MAAPALCFVVCTLLLCHGSAQAGKAVPGVTVAPGAEDGSLGMERFMGRAVDVSSNSRHRRELLGGARETTTRDVFAPVTNTVTVPATNPASAGGIVTVPATNPGTGTGFATNPNLPPLYPEPSTTPDPTTMPAPFTNPVAAPFTAPVTNPATTPTATPGTSPITNPATTYPGGSAGAGVGVGSVPTTPVYQAPATTVPTPTTVQPAAGGTGQSMWCVAKAGVTEAALQDGLDFACGMGGADCSALQPMGSCYNPNTIQAHASYAFNAYYQRSPSPASCDFGGAGMLVATNPSSGACMYQTSSGSSSGAVTGTTTGPVGVTPSFGPVGTTTGTGPAVSSGGSGSTVLNANTYPGETSMYGPGNPTGFSDASSGAASLNCSWILSLIWIFTFAYVKMKV